MDNINLLLTQFNGTEQVYKYVGKYVYTDGVRHLAKEYGAYWLIDAVFSHQLNPKVKGEEFQSWKLKRIESYSFLLACDDGNQNPITAQKIPFSDFTGNEVTLWLVNGVLMLPSEY